MSAELVGIISVGVGLALALFALWSLSLKPLQANVETLRTNLTETNRSVRELGDRMTRLEAAVATPTSGPTSAAFSTLSASKADDVLDP